MFLVGPTTQENFCTSAVLETLDPIFGGVGVAFDAVKRRLFFPEEDVDQLRRFRPDASDDRGDDVDVDIDPLQAAQAIEGLERDHVELAGLKLKLK